MKCCRKNQTIFKLFISRCLTTRCIRPGSFVVALALFDGELLYSTMHKQQVGRVYVLSLTLILSSVVSYFGLCVVWCGVVWCGVVWCGVV
jgi:hypothetical protein